MLGDASRGEGESMSNYDCLVDSTTHSPSRRDRLSKYPLLIPENTVPAPHTQFAVDAGEGTVMVLAGELQGDGFRRGDDCFPTETCGALRLHSVDYLLGFRLTKCEGGVFGYPSQSDLILCFHLSHMINA